MIWRVINSIWLNINMEEPQMMIPKRSIPNADQIGISLAFICTIPLNPPSRMDNITPIYNILSPPLKVTLGIRTFF